MPSAEDYEALLREPREDMGVEIKGWLDLSTNDHKALLARAIIALANHGGGFIVIGLTRLPTGSYSPAANRPAALGGYDEDTVNAVVKAYADPSFHCDVRFVASPAVGDQFPIITVPGGGHVPVQAKRGSPDNNKTLSAGRIYVRRPGPESAEPGSPEEWRALISRCIRANRDDLLDAMRGVLSGLDPLGAQAARAAAPGLFEQLELFTTETMERWKGLAPRDGTGAPRFSPGYYRLAYAIDGGFEQPSFPELLAAIERASVRHTGWPEWAVLNRDPLRPAIRDNSLEAFTADEPEELITDPPHADFWRARPDGKFILVRGYQEDVSTKFPPGTALDITLPVWRVGECFLHAAAMCRELKVEAASVVFQVCYSGLAGRALVSLSGRRLLHNDRIAKDDKVNLSTKVDAKAIEDGLPEMLESFLRPLYHRFAFFEPSSAFFVEEVQRLRSGRF